MLKEVLIVDVEGVLTLYYIPYWTLIIHPLFNEGTEITGQGRPPVKQPMSRFGKQCGRPTLFLATLVKF